jgi:DnaJ-class molecular chaperone
MSEECPYCKGRGYHTRERALLGQMVTVTNPCLVCSEPHPLRIDGTGSADERTAVPQPFGSDYLGPQP